MPKFRKMTYIYLYRSASTKFQEQDHVGFWLMQSRESCDVYARAASTDGDGILFVTQK